MIKYTQASERQEFETKLCCCFQDCSTCCYACFCYPCASARAWSGSRGEECACLHVCGLEAFTRSNIRHARNMPQKLCADCCTHIFCPICTLVQDLRELKLIEAESQIPDKPTVVPPPIPIPAPPNVNDSGPSSPSTVSSQDDETDNQDPFLYNPETNPNAQSLPAFYFPQQFAYNPYAMPQPIHGAPVFAYPFPPQFSPQTVQQGQPQFAQFQPQFAQFQPQVQPQHAPVASAKHQHHAKQKTPKKVKIQQPSSQEQSAQPTGKASAHQTPKYSSKSSAHQTPKSSSMASAHPNAFLDDDS